VTSRERVVRARRQLAAAVVLEALLWATAFGMAVVAIAAALHDVFVLPLPLREAFMSIAAAGALGCAALVLWRGRGARSIEGVALWVEERDDRLRYALVTAIDPVASAPSSHPELHCIAAGADIEGLARRASVRGLSRAAIACAILAGVLVPLRPGTLLSDVAVELERHLRNVAVVPDRLADFAVTVVPPAYSRLPTRTLNAPSNIASLVGSRVTFAGRGVPDGLVAQLDSVAFDARPAADGWSIGLTMPKLPAVLTLKDQVYRRLLTLEPITDSAPDVRLLLPAHDTTYQVVPRGPLAISASLSDDIGLHYAYVEYLVTSGSGESFTTRLLNGTRIEYQNAGTGTLGTTVLLDTMKLAPGNVLHIRVLAYDYNDVTGPGIGVSETRTLRIAEPVDSTSINPAPPLPIDSMWISQRLLNMKTDTLIRTKARHTREELENRSSEYGNAQEAIRQKVLAVIGVIEAIGEGSSFQTEVSTKLREVSDLMWTAREDLGIALPDTAMPYMIRILKILDDIRLAKRYYIRGTLKPVPVNIARVRLTGKDSASTSGRTPRVQLPEAAAALEARLEAVAALAHDDLLAATDSLVYARVTALGVAPAVAGLLQRAIDLMRRGVAADSLLGRARLALEPPARQLGGPLDWGGLPR
jgi:hypothetical protein